MAQLNQFSIAPVINYHRYIKILINKMFELVYVAVRNIKRHNEMISCILYCIVYVIFRDIYFFMSKLSVIW